MNLANENYLGQNANPWMAKFFIIGCVLITLALIHAVSVANELTNTIVADSEIVDNVRR